MIFLVIFKIFFSLPSFAAKIPAPEIEIFPNGLTLAWFEDARFPIIDIALLIQSGYKDDATGKSGTAQLVSLTLDRGALGKSELELSQWIESLGANQYVNVDDDTFSIGVHGLSQDAHEFLKYLSTITLSPDFSATQFEKRKSQLIDSWSHIGDEAESLATIGFHRTLSSGTTYGRAGIHSLKEIATVERHDLLQYHRLHFTPKNAVMMIAGRFDRVPLRNEILKVFGYWQGEKPKKQNIVFSNPGFELSKNQILIMNRKDTNQAHIKIGMKGPAFKTPEHYALTVGNAMLGEFFNSRLNRIVRDELALTYSIQSQFTYSKDFSIFQIGSSTRNEMTGELVKKVFEILGNLLTKPLPETEVATAREFLVGEFPLSTATIGAVASRWLSGYIFDGGPDFLNEFIPKVSAVKSAEVSLALKKHLKLNQLKIVVAGDKKEIVKSLKKSGFSNFKVMEKEYLNQ